MKAIFTSFIVSIFMLTTAIGQNNVEVSASDNWIGFMNVFNLNGGYEFGSAWDVAALKTTFDLVGNTVTLQPNFNTYGDADPTDEFWINQTTGEGNKQMEALTFVEPGATFNGNDLTFSGSVVSNTLDAGYSVKYFIKALDPNDNFSDAFGGSKIFDLPSDGSFSVSATAAELPAGLVIQYGFSVTGRNANPADEGSSGNVVLGAGSVSVNDINNIDDNISVYPNPVTDRLNIQSEAQVETYQVTTLLGQTVLSGRSTNQVDVSNLVSGNYLITVQSEDGQKTLKFLKK